MVTIVMPEVSMLVQKFGELVDLSWRGIFLPHRQFALAQPLSSRVENTLPEAEGKMDVEPF